MHDLDRSESQVQTVQLTFSWQATVQACTKRLFPVPISIEHVAAWKYLR